ncbi:UPF0690 protein C1orf52 homolog [Protopterus annectens]|uniref:UPF0690 protein C1orf52 homolog n=1 Tax=Protopterus annectens TaxID=7888 RepID=UPI001CFC3F76|nr:UPF0690 protein C1orf52 homolog [Protopterus annectens]
MAWESKDPLNYFAVYDSSSDSEKSDSEEVLQKKVNNKEVPIDNVKSSVTFPAALPKPDELFKKISKPAFLYNPLNKEIDWDKRVIKGPEEAPKEFKVWKTNAVPPPESYVAQEEKKAPPPGMDMAVKWSNVYMDNGDDAPQHVIKARFLPEEEDIVQSDSDSDEPSSAKKCKIDPVQQKNK